MRFSTAPALGGSAAVIEIVPDSRGTARVRAFALEGHPRTGWERRSQVRFRLGAAQWRRLRTTVDASFARAAEAAAEPETDKMIICMDGPGYLTERVARGQVMTLAGFCPPSVREDHPNVAIACRLGAILRDHVVEEQRPDLSLYDRCSRH